MTDGRQSMWNGIPRDITIKIPKSDKWTDEEVRNAIISVYGQYEQTPRHEMSRM